MIVLSLDAVLKYVKSSINRYREELNMIETEAYQFNLSTVLNTNGLFNPFTTALEDTLNLMDLVCIERIEKNRLEVTFMLSNEISLQYHTLFTNITEHTLEMAIKELFEFVEYDVDKLERLSKIGLLGEMLTRFQLDIVKQVNKKEVI